MPDKPFDLCDRTFEFAKDVLQFVKKCPKNFVTMDLLHQLIDSSSSAGANTEEANSAQSDRDFIAKLAIALKEVRESRYWLRLIQTVVPPSPEGNRLIQEAQELSHIMASRIRNRKTKLQNTKNKKQKTNNKEP